MEQDFSDIRAIIFDMDGVLFLSSGCHRKAFEEVLASIGIADFPYSKIAGMRTDEAIEKVLLESKETKGKHDIDELVRRKRARAMELLMEFGEISSGSSECIARLSEKYRLALASSAAPQTVEFFLGKCGYGDVFEFCLDGSSVSEAKPSPDIYVRAAEMFGIVPEQCVVIEDSTNGVLSAVSAGMRVIGIQGTTDPQELLDSGAVFVAENLRAISSALAKESV